MSGLIGEIQKGCLDDSVSIESLLRRVKLAAVKLKLGELETWVDNELNGYPSNEVPEHRILYGEPTAWNPFHGWIPIQIDDAFLSDLLGKASITQSIGSLRDLISKEQSGTVRLPVPPGVVTELNKIFSTSASRIVIQIPRGSVIGVLDFVRNKVLDWSLEMEKNGVLGEGHTFNEKEIESAKTITPVIQIGNIENFAGNIGAGNTSGNITLTTANTTEIRGKLQQLLDATPQLVAAGANDSLPTTLDAAIVETERSEPDRFKLKVLVQGLRTALAGAAGNLTAEGAMAVVNGIAKMLS